MLKLSIKLNNVNKIARSIKPCYGWIMKSKDINLTANAYTAIKKDILGGRYVPGEKLVLAKLRENYDMGASPIREALSQLLTEDLVKSENQRGFRVSPVSIEDLRDIYEARAHLEALLVGIAIEKGDDHWEAGIVAAAHRLFKYDRIDHLEDLSIHDWEERHHDFHDAIVNGSKARVLLETRHSLYEKAARYRNLWLQENTREEAAFDANLSEHKTIMDAVLDRDADLAKKLVFDHILVPVKIIEQVF